MTDAGDAWWTVSRNADLHPLGFMGNFLAYAGDSDGDGRPELVAYEGYYPVDDAGHTGMAFRLVEAPSNTSGGSVDVDDVTIARWVYPDAEIVGWTGGKSLGANKIEASQDFDGDGIVDYMFGNSGNWYEPSLAPDFTPNAISLWYGPPDYQDKKGSFMDMADAQTATITTGDTFFLGSFAVTVPPGGSDPWQVAAHVFPVTQDGLGSNHAALALLTDADFQGEEDPVDAFSIQTASGYEATYTVQADDIDGDGFRDLVVSTRRYPDRVAPPRVMVFAGPFDGDRTMDSGYHHRRRRGR
ncbi:MAG: hypothetical protein GXP62_05745 [Oligoflexia bacterium]|nr:hypothetical protein [Oligoflexia bacterium]